MQFQALLYLLFFKSNYNSNIPNQNLMLKQCILLLLLFTLLASNPGWIFNKTIPTTLQVTRLLPNAEGLLVQSNRGIYLAPFNNPNAVRQWVTTQLNRTAPLTVSLRAEAYLFMGQRAVNHYQANSSCIRAIPQIHFQSNLVEFGNRVYFYNQACSPHLYAYDLDSGEVHEGPFLRNSSVLSAMEVHRQTGILFVSADGVLLQVDLPTMVSKKILDSQSPIKTITISDSRKFLVLSQSTQWGEFKSVLRMQEAGDYVLVYTSSYSNHNDLNKGGFKILEEEDVCYEVTYNSIYTQEHVRSIVEFDCSEPYDKVIGSIEGESSVHELADDLQTVYSIVEKEESKYLMKHAVSKKGLVLLEMKLLPDEVFPLWPESMGIMEVFRDCLVFRSMSTLSLYVWNLKRQAFMCFEEIRDRIIVESTIQQLVLNPAGNIIYLSLHNSWDILFSINLDDCSIQSKQFDNIIVKIWFTDKRLFIKLSADVTNVYELDPNTKEIIGNRYYIPSFSEEMTDDGLFGLVIEDISLKLVSYDDNFKIDQQTQVPCSVNFVSLSSGTDHLSVECNNIYYLYDEDLTYLGSTSLAIQELRYDFKVRETFRSSLRFDKEAGKLHSSIYKAWNVSVIKTASARPISNLHFYNQTTAVFLTVDNGSYLLALAHVEGLNLLITQTVALGLSSARVLLAATPLKWSCSKEEIMLQYSQMNDNFNTYINIYKISSFKLLYVHRVVEFDEPAMIVGTFNFVAELTCKGLLLVTHPQGLEVVEISKRKSFIPKSIIVTEQVAMSSDDQMVMVFGNGNTGKKGLEVWSIQTLDRNISYLLSSAHSQKSKFFLIDNLLYALDHQELTENFQLVLKEVSDCVYLSQKSLVCLDLGGSFHVFPQTHPLPTLEWEEVEGKIVVSALQDFLVVFNLTALSIFGITSQGLVLRQIIRPNDLLIDAVAISSDSTSILAYSHIHKNLYLWQYGACPALTTLQDGVCVCMEQTIKRDGACLCPDGQFMNGDKCFQCNFLCQQCSGNAGGCTNLSTAGIILIVGTAVFACIVGILLYRCIRNRQAKLRRRAEEEALMKSHSELTDDYSSRIN